MPAASRSWQPTYTPKETIKSGLATKATYNEVAPVVRAIVEEHLATGTPRQLWEPGPNYVRQIAAKYIARAGDVRDYRLAAEVDPLLEECQQTLEESKANLDTVRLSPRQITTVESNVTYSGAAAVGVHDRHCEKVEADRTNGKHHHDRSSPTLRRIGRFAPWIEALGFLAFISYYLNVPVFQPWEDWLGWTFAMTVVVFIILGQSWLVHHAARSHNRGREAKADGNRHEAEAESTRRNWYLAATGVVAAAITGGMIVRGTVALGQARLGTAVVMVLLAAVTGLLIPTLAYLATALDGSRISRERDGLAAGLDDDFVEQSELKGEIQAALDSVTGNKKTLEDKTFWDICTAVQAAVDKAFVPYNFCRLQIGNLEAPPPEKAKRSATQNPERAFPEQISTGLPGAEPVNMHPLLDRQSRLEALDKERGDLQTALEQIPEHPWTRSSFPRNNRPEQS